MSGMFPCSALFILPQLHEANVEGKFYKYIIIGKSDCNCPVKLFPKQIKTVRGQSNVLAIQDNDTYSKFFIKQTNEKGDLT